MMQSFLTLLLLTTSILLAKDIPLLEYEAPNAKPIQVRDTDSAMGRYNLHPKEITLWTLVKAHGHLCDGLVLSFVELSALFEEMFPEGIVDRTDLRVVAKNSPCLVDTSAMMSGARINHRTLSLDNSLGGSFIVQQISTRKAYKVSLRDKKFLHALKVKEAEIREKNKRGEKVTTKDIDVVEALADDVIKHLLTYDIKSLVKVTPLKNYSFQFSIKDFAPRSDTVNKNVQR